jgi:hypothetical protein
MAPLRNFEIMSRFGAERLCTWVISLLTKIEYRNLCGWKVGYVSSTDNSLF